MNDLVINLSGLRCGGGKLVADEVMNSYINRLKFRNTIIFGGKELGKKMVSNKFKFIAIPRPLGFVSDQIIISAILLVRLLTGSRDTLLNFSDMPIVFPGNQIIFFDWAYAVYDKDCWGRLSPLPFAARVLKKQFFWALSIFVDQYIVQTTYMRKLLSKKVRFNNIVVNPIGITALADINTASLVPCKSRNYIDDLFALLGEVPNASKYIELKSLCSRESIKHIILCPNSYNAHKGFDQVNQLIRSRELFNQRALLVLLVEQIDAGNLFSMKRSMLPQGLVLNLGKVHWKLLLKIYGISSIVFNPSQLESFGFSYYESALLGVRQVTPLLPHVPSFARDYSYVNDSLDSMKIAIANALNDYEAFGRINAFEFSCNLRHEAEVSVESLSSFLSG